MTINLVKLPVKLVAYLNDTTDDMVIRPLPPLGTLPQGFSWVPGVDSVLGEDSVLVEDLVLSQVPGRSPGVGGLSAPSWRLLAVLHLVHAVVF